MASLEAGFNSELRKNLSDVFGNRIFVQLIPNMIRTGKKPFDFQFLYDGKFYAVECKWVKSESLALNDIRPHQPECLQKVIDCGGIGYFCVGFKKYKVAFVYKPDALDYLVEMCKGQNISIDLFLKATLEHPSLFIRIDRKKIGDCTRWQVENLLKC